MASTINELMPDDGPKVMWSPNFRQMIEDHLQYLKNHPTTQVITIRNEVAYKGEGDFITVLQEYGVPRHLHWIVMRLNGYTSPMEYMSDDTEMVVPSTTVIDALLKVHRVNQRM